MESLGFFREYLAKLSDAEVSLLRRAMEERECEKEFGCSTLDDLASLEGRKPQCPFCKDGRIVMDGRSKSGSRRYLCKTCGTRFSLTAKTVLSGSKATLWQWRAMVRLMSYNVPLDLIADIARVSHNTALLMRRKLFASISRWQSKAKLSGTVFIDEIYVPDSIRPKSHFGPNRRGLSKDKCCIFVAIDANMSMVASFVGHGSPTSKEISEALGGHLEKGGAKLIVHDGLRSHAKAVADSKSAEEIHKSTSKDPNDLKAMLLINSFCSWLQRFLGKFVGMDTEYLQDYLNWFVYLFRCKRQMDRWPEDIRVIRHMLLDDAVLKRKEIWARRAKSRKEIEARRRDNGKAGANGTHDGKRRK